MISKGEKKLMMNIYQIIITEFFTKFLESDICSYDSGSLGEYYNAEEKLNYHLYIGITIIHRVFEYIFIKTKNIMTTYYYTDSAYSYYLEYIEQIYKANLLFNFNYSDAMLFVYNKTIFKYYEGESLELEIGRRQILSNIIELNNTETQVLNITNEEFQELFSKIIKNTNFLLSWKDTFLDFSLDDRGRKSDVVDTYGGGCRPKPYDKNLKQDNYGNVSEENTLKPKTVEDEKSKWWKNDYTYSLRTQFCHYFLEKFLKNLDKLDTVIDFLVIIYQRLDISIIQWKNFLEYFIVEITKNTKKNKKGFQNMEDFLIQFYSSMDTLREKINANEYKYVTEWILSGNNL